MCAHAASGSCYSSNRIKFVHVAPSSPNTHTHTHTPRVLVFTRETCTHSPDQYTTYRIDDHAHAPRWHNRVRRSAHRFVRSYRFSTTATTVSSSIAAGARSLTHTHTTRHARDACTTLIIRRAWRAVGRACARACGCWRSLANARIINHVECLRVVCDCATPPTYIHLCSYK